ncbi:MAG: hypothetical protein ACRDM7_21830 [Thermoleophilaceae bacterium]
MSADDYEKLAWVIRLLEDKGTLELVHCDRLVLHRRGECHYCDKHGAAAQRARAEHEIPFSGEAGAPDALFRVDEVIRRWPGNVPVKKGERHTTYLGHTYVVGEDQ